MWVWVRPDRPSLHHLTQPKRAEKPAFFGAAGREARRRAELSDPSVRQGEAARVRLETLTGRIHDPAVMVGGHLPLHFVRFKSSTS
jgi:hypothetical protein